MAGVTEHFVLLTQMLTLINVYLIIENLRSVNHVIFKIFEEILDNNINQSLRSHLLFVVHLIKAQISNET